jgi:exonuclease III
MTGIQSNNLGFNLSLSCVNCNSLNMSDSTKINQQKKILAITRLKSDIIFLSDIRLSNKNNRSCSMELERLFRTNPYGNYNFYHNSTWNKRGVGILIKNSLNVKIVNRRDDPEQNYIVLMAEFNNMSLALGSIYGPNDFNPDFFARLNDDLNTLGAGSKILAGDWNCTLSGEEIRYNIDCFNMRALPNARHTELLKTLCDRHNLIDPYRLTYPNKRDYTFVPRSTESTNRSRIDFFLIDDKLAKCKFECNISAARQSSMFDHKAVSLIFSGQKKSGSGISFIKNSTLEDDLVDHIAFATTVEAYVLHIDSSKFNPGQKNRLLNEVGRLKKSIKDAGPAPCKFSCNEELTLNRNQHLANIDEYRRILDLEHLLTLDPDPDPDVFLETLLCMIKNELITFQAFKLKKNREQIHNFEKSLYNLKADDNPDFEKISGLERELEQFRDRELEYEISQFATFDTLKNEKMTPQFLNIAKNTKKEGDLSDICNDNGLPFNNTKERNDYIVNYYKDLFTLKPEAKNDVRGAIERFLGPEILENPVVKNSKLTDAESLRIGNNFTVNEFDEVVKDINTRTAGGPDGISNSVVKKIWKYIRDPLTKYANFCKDKGELTHSFRTAAIRLIPKKGDCARIKNWRPISLLNCTYKVISKAINNRLKKIATRILSRAQKGFVPGRYIQECIINLTETINYCEKNNIESVLMAIDMQKAFDSVRHDFMREVYKFFGFPENFIKILEVFTTGRKACIMLENGLSEEFDLGLGSTQGNGPSPLQFNFCEQILIFKIEFDDRIKSVYAIEYQQNLRLEYRVNKTAVANFDPEIRGRNAYEVTRVTDKAECFADDLSTITPAEAGCVDAIKEDLSNFANISGLKCNVDKSIILPIGFREGSNLEVINNSGFEVAEKVKILGIEITKDFSDLKKNFEGAIEKIINIKNFWARFNLSVQGRINIAKTFMLSQLGYLGCICEPDQLQFEHITSVIENFIVGKLNISKNRLYRQPKEGGLGMIPIKEYLIAQRVGWLKRIVTAPAPGPLLVPADNWQADILSKCTGKIALLEANSFKQDRNPVLYTITKDFADFKRAFLLHNRNFFISQLFLNPLMTNETGRPGVNDSWLNRNTPPLTAQDIQEVKISDISDGLNLKSIDSIVQRTGLNLSLLSYMRLMQYWRNAMSVIKKLGAGNEVLPPISIDNFLGGCRKGSKRIRKILMKINYGESEIKKLPAIKNFLRMNNITEVENKVMQNAHALWGANFLNNAMREFILKFYNNILGLNTRVSHFNRAVMRHCSLCTSNNMANPFDETFNHLFNDCSITKRLKKAFIEKNFRGWVHHNEHELKKFWLVGQHPDTMDNDNLFLRVIAMLVNFYIWDIKLKRKRGSLASLSNDIKFFLDSMLRQSTQLRCDMVKINEAFFRNL